MTRDENAPTVEFDPSYEDMAQRASDARDAIESGLRDWVSVFADSSNSTTKQVEVAKELGKAGCHLCRGPIGATGIYPTIVIEPLTKQLDAHEPADCVRIECAISLGRMAKSLFEGHPCPGEDDRGELRMDLFERIYESLYTRASDGDRKRTPKRVLNRCILEVKKLDALRQAGHNASTVLPSIARCTT